MTTIEFKNSNPDLAHLEGHELWDAMEREVLMKTPALPQIEPKDWLGNSIETGDEICFIQIKTESGGFAGFCLMPDGSKSDFYKPPKPIENCWIPGEYRKVNDDMTITEQIGEYTFTTPLSHIINNPFMPSDFYDNYVLAIKGKSDVAPTKSPA